MDTVELDRESAELLPDRQALCSWQWSPCGHESWSAHSWSGSWGWGWSSHCQPKCW